ncbi:MAG: DNA polymerase III subunit gamma/tau, partial [Flavobacteriales bacterium]
MLSAAAFNAFLKTLEEPPAHAIFILATTEKHKIIPTILSRCQIFDFNRIKVRDISEHLAHIAAQEGVTAETEALHVIAEKADGAMRDALSIFDQVVAFCGRNLTYQSVIQNLNVLDYEYYFKLTRSILDEDIPACLVLFNEILEKGFDGHHFITGLGQHFRNLMVSKDSQTVALMELSEQVSVRYIEQGQQADVRLLVFGLQMINECDTQYRSSKHQRLLVELTLMNLASIPYNQREGEKKKFKLKPFRTRESIAATPAGVRNAGRSEPPVPTSETQAVVTRTSPAKDVKPALGQKEAILKTPQLLSLKELMKQHSEQKQQETEQTAAAKERPSRAYTIEE